MNQLRVVVSWTAFTFLSLTLSARQRVEPVSVDETVQEKKLIKKVEPVYPEYAPQVPVRGPVILDVVANEKGEVVDVKIVKGGNPVVQKPVYEAVKQWRYSPTYVHGKAVPVKFRVTVPVNASRKREPLFALQVENPDV